MISQVQGNKHPGTKDVDQSHWGTGIVCWNSMTVDRPSETVVINNQTWTLHLEYQLKCLMEALNIHGDYYLQEGWWKDLTTECFLDKPAVQYCPCPVPHDSITDCAVVLTSVRREGRIFSKKDGKQHITENHMMRTYRSNKACIIVPSVKVFGKRPQFVLLLISSSRTIDV